IITVFKKECFVSETNCHPVDTKNARIFTDVGELLGPTSDLGNGCVAVLSFARPGEFSQSDFQTKVYKACARDAKDLDKGIFSTLLASVDGAAYMYNDF